MDKEKLKEANRLNELIEEHECALSCFEYDNNHWTGGAMEPDIRNMEPQLIIELEDFCGCTQTPIPTVLNGLLIEAIKEALKDNLSKLRTEFNEL